MIFLSNIGETIGMVNKDRRAQIALICILDTDYERAQLI